MEKRQISTTASTDAHAAIKNRTCISFSTILCLINIGSSQVRRKMPRVTAGHLFTGLSLTELFQFFPGSDVAGVNILYLLTCEFIDTSIVIYDNCNTIQCDYLIGKTGTLFAVL